MIWKEQILMDIEGGKPLVLYTYYGSHMNNKKYQEILDYLFETFGYMRNPKYPAMGAIRGHGEWVKEPGENL